MKRDHLYIGAIVILAVVIFFMDKCNEKEKAKLRNEIAKQSGIIKEKEGVFSQLITRVDNQRDLLSELKGTLDSNFTDIKKIIKNNDERLLLYSTSFLRFKEKSDTVLIYPMDSTSEAEWRFSLLYPDSIKPILAYEGFIIPKLRRIAGQWTSPNQLAITAILTETSKGNWNSRLVAPEYVIVDSIIVRSLPPEKIVASKKFAFIGGIGAGYSFDVNSPIFSLNIGARIKKMHFVVNGNTRKDVQLNVSREF